MIERDWREPFFIAGEVIYIRRLTGDWSAKLHEPTRALVRQAAVKIGTPETACILTATSVIKFLASQLEEHGKKLERRFYRKFVTGWHWQEPTSDFEPWRRIETDDLKRYEEAELYAVLRQYAGRRSDISDIRRAAALKRWRPQSAESEAAE